jgi:nitrite reductase (NO-forming)
MKVNGIEYNSEMPGVKLTHQEVADVLNFIRNSWGNKAAAILPAEIKAGLKAPSGNYTKY